MNKLLVVVDQRLLTDMNNLIGDVTLTFKRLSDEWPPLEKYVLVSRYDGLYFLIACLEIWNEGTQDECLLWSEHSSSYKFDDLDQWPTWAHLPFKEGYDD